MMNLMYDFKREGDLYIFKVTGFMFYSKHHHVVDEIIQEIKKLDEQQQPYRLLFDLRGLKAVEPRMLAKIKELDKAIYESKVTKVGTVMDSIIAKIQQMRTAESEYYMENAMMFSNYDECLAWLNDPNQRVRPDIQREPSKLA